MAMDLSVIVEMAKAAPALSLCGGAIWFARTRMQAYDEHLRECGKIPKESIIDRIDEVSSDVKTLHVEMREMGKGLQLLVGRQMERDRSANQRRRAED